MVDVRTAGGFHIGGRTVKLEGLPTRVEQITANGPKNVIDPNGEIVVEQLYVQYIRLAAPTASVPVVLVHGGGMTGVTWEDTPDGRPGWQWRFAEAGFDVYTPDAVERGRSGWAPFPTVWPREPIWRTHEFAWNLFRCGPLDGFATRTGYPGGRFAASRFDHFARQFVPRWAGNDVATQAAYDALVRRIGPCVLVAHSQGGAFAMRAALAAPDLVRAVVAVEPTGTPDASRPDLAQPEPERLAHVPHLLVWGDHLAEHPPWPDHRARVERWWSALAQSSIIDLPALGIRGNSHFPMSDDNSDEVLALVLGWLRGHGLAA